MKNRPKHNLQEGPDSSVAQGRTSKSKKAYLAEYRAAEFVIFFGDTFVEFKVGQVNAELDRLLRAFTAKNAAFITAWNPRSKPTSAAKNKAANKKLLRELERTDSVNLCSQGRAADYTTLEDSFTTFGIDRKTAIALGAKYDQNAIIWIAKGQPPKLVWTAK